MRTNTTGILIAAALLWPGGLALGQGDLNPTNGPAPCMHTLEEIYQQLLSATQQVAALQQQVAANQQTLAQMQQRLVAVGAMQQTAGDMALIPAGSFVMGACTNVGQEFYGGETPQHVVAVSAFYLEKHEVTWNLWQDVRQWATNAGYAFAWSGAGKEGAHPTYQVVWFDALAWCNARSQRDGFTPCYTNADGPVYTNSADMSFTGGCNWEATGYRLPTEAEWEKAARGGQINGRFPWNDAHAIQHARANYNANPATYAYDTSPTTGYHPDHDSGDPPFTSPVGSFEPNGYGLYDMAGNVSEWCWDLYDVSYYGSSPDTDPRGPAAGINRVLRGGAWVYQPFVARCAARYSNYPTDDRYNDVGFRCARRF